jgi:hypothetical protein
LTDPNKLMRWMMLPMDPKLLAPVMNLLNPNVPGTLGHRAPSPQVTSMATAPMNPNWYGAWMGGMASPNPTAPP